MPILDVVRICGLQAHYVALFHNQYTDPVDHQTRSQKRVFLSLPCGWSEWKDPLTPEGHKHREEDGGRVVKEVTGTGRGTG